MNSLVLLPIDRVAPGLCSLPFDGWSQTDDQRPCPGWCESVRMIAGAAQKDASSSPSTQSLMLTCAPPGDNCAAPNLRSRAVVERLAEVEELRQHAESSREFKTLAQDAANGTLRDPHHFFISAGVLSMFIRVERRIAKNIKNRCKTITTNRKT